MSGFLRRLQRVENAQGFDRPIFVVVERGASRERLQALADEQGAFRVCFVVTGVCRCPGEIAA